MSGAASERTQAALTAFFAATVFALGLMKVVDTDTWTHLAFGRWIVEQRAIPLVEPFIATSPPFPYTNWLFGLVYYLAWLAGGFTGVVLLKATIAAAIFALLFRLALRGHGNAVVALAAMAVAVLLVRHRFVERPDTAMMLALAFSLYALDAYVRDGRRLLYALPLAHLAWANAHTSIALMVVPFGAYLAGGLAHRLLDRRLPQRRFLLGLAPTPAQAKTIGLVFGASFLASLVSPYFIDQYLHSTGALASDWWRQVIVELQPPTWRGNPLLFVFGALAAASFALAWRRLSMVDLLAAMPFLVLPFTAKRFVWFAAIAAVFLARNLALALQDSPRLQRCTLARPALAATAAGVALLAALQVMLVRPFDGDRSLEPGFGVSHLYLPEGALAYLDARSVTGTVFNTFQWGGYMTWRDFPKRRPYIDGRGFLDTALLERGDAALQRADVLDELHRRYGFEAVLIQYPVVTQKAAYEIVKGDFVMDHPGWALVYWDDLSLLYLRRDGPHVGVVAADEYRHIRPAKGIDRATLADAAGRERVMAEIRRNVETTRSSRGRYFEGMLLAEAGRQHEAIEAFAQVADVTGFDHRRDAKVGMGDAWLRLGDAAQAIRLYEEAGALRRDAALLQKLGLAHARRGERDAAVAAYEDALAMNPSLVSAYRELAELHRAAGRPERAEELLRAAQTAQRSRQGEEHFNRGTQAYREGRLAAAIEEYRKSIEVNPGSPVAYSNLAYVYYDSGDFDKALEYHRRALDIDIGTAISHYGLALIYEARNDRDNAIRHWEEYLRLEPSGYYNRRAREHLEKLR